MADPTTVTCPHCGAMNPAEDAYCSSCHRPISERADDDPDDGPGVWGGYQWTTHQWGPGTPLLFGIALALLGVAVDLLNATSQTCTTRSGVTTCVSHAQSTVAALGWRLLIAGGIVAAVGAVLLWNARAASGSDRAS